MSIAVTGIAHVGIRVHDMDRSVAFYGLFGFEYVMGPIGSEPVAISRHPSGIEINFILNAAPEATVNVLMDVPVKHPGYTHMALRVKSVDGARAHLEANGHTISGEMTFPNGHRAIFVRDPDGNTVELNDTVAD